MQAVGFISLVYLVLACFYQAIQGQLTFASLIFAAPFLSTSLALALGLYKVGKSNLLCYIPLFLTFDSALQLYVFLETKLRFKEERHWVKLGEGQYYHTGSEIRTE